MEDYNVPFHYIKGHSTSFADKLCLAFPFLRGRIRAIHPKDSRFTRKIREKRIRVIHPKFHQN
jgi:hypothetical protein